MSNYKQISNANQNVHFSRAMFSETEHSRMVATPIHLTSFNAGDIVPIYCREILPYENLKIDMDFVIRQTTLLTPTMGQMHVDFYAFFVPNRIVNQSWKAVEGENFSGSWTANSVSLAPLVDGKGIRDYQIPVGSVADYYGFPTQKPISSAVLGLCHDLKFRGYVMIWNEYFRDQNYQPPIPMSTLNVYQGFLDGDNSTINLDGKTNPVVFRSSTAPSNPSSAPDGSYGVGAIKHSLYGNGDVSPSTPQSTIYSPGASGRFRATHKPLKANKLHDYFTSVLPSPQKSQTSVFAPASGLANFIAPVDTVSTPHSVGNSPLMFDGSPSGLNNGDAISLFARLSSGNGIFSAIGGPVSSVSGNRFLTPSNLVAKGENVDVSGLGISVDDLRMASAVQQVYEIQARGGSRYRELIQSFFGITADDPYSDIPKCLGHISRDLDLFQTAQTSSSSDGSTPQGNLAGFGYTSSGGHLFQNLFLEHGYVHIFAIVRHRNIYSSYLARDNFRLNMLDFYLPPLANISEQPIYTREINPFSSKPNDGFGYQESWAEYRFEPDVVSGMMRPMASGAESFALWNYADDFVDNLQIANGEWLKSNSEEVLNRSLAVTSNLAPQFKAMFKFIVDKDLPMPTYSVPGADII